MNIVITGGSKGIGKAIAHNYAAAGFNIAICGKDGYFVCPQTGIALASVRNSLRQGWIPKGSRVVVVSTATGLKFTDSAAEKLQGNIITAEDCKTETVARILKV